MVKHIGFVILVLGLAVTGPGFRDKIGPDDDVVPSSHPAIRPLEIVTSSVSRGLASLRASRAGFNTGEGRRAEIRRAADDLFDVGEIARRALGQHWKGLGSREREEFVALFRAALTHSFVTIVERYPADHVASVDEEVAGSFARCVPGSPRTRARRSGSSTACPGAARSGPSTNRARRRERGPEECNELLPFARPEALAVLPEGPTGAISPTSKRSSAARRISARLPSPVLKPARDARRLAS